ncbi:MAG: glycosyltransferase family 1 protein [Armatimonadetes bacterium]|nr:glycosyltransferase family 1 protein [Armatimonadota bacterium]
MKVLLIPNLVEYHAVSIKRYADELHHALIHLAPTSWQFESLTCHHSLPSEQTIITCHDIIPLLTILGKLDIPISNNARRTFPKIIQCLGKASQIITVSESSKQNLLEFTSISPDHIHVVYSGLNPNFTPHPTEAPTRHEERMIIKKSYGIPATAKVLMHVGTTGHYKNTAALIKLLKALGDDVWLLRVGAPFHNEEAILVEQLGVGKRLVHTGKVAGDTLLAAHYRAADLFVFPSFWEGFGWPPLEAMACGTPTITSNTASLPEVAGPNGITFSPQDDEEIARVTDSLLRDPARLAKLGSDGLAWSKNFTWQRSAQQTLRVYEKIGK